jgi:putative ABC transport system substrate-binding protein
VTKFKRFLVIGLVIVLAGTGALLVMMMSSSSSGNGAPLRVGIVNAVSMRNPLVEAFQDEMTQLGYVEGEDVVYLYDGPYPDAEERRAWAQFLVEEGVDIIFGVTTPGAQTAASVTSDIPVVFAPVTDPVGAGLVEDLNQPEGNVTGITNGNPHPLRMQFLFELDPTIETVYAPHNPQSPPAVLAYDSMLEVIAENGATLIDPNVSTTAEARQAIEAIPDDADAIFIVPDPMIANFSAQISEAAIQRGIPFVSLSRNEVEEGALLAYGEELDEVAAQVARMVDAIYNGADPSEMPVETAEFFLSLNLNTAGEIGLDVPESFLARVHYIVRDDN